MIHIGITAKIKDFEVPFFIGYFKIPKEQDLRKTASIACKNYAEKRANKNWLKRLKEVEVYERLTNKTLLTIKL